MVKKRPNSIPPDRYWNYRIMEEHSVRTGETWLELREVHYRGGKMDSYSSLAASVVGETVTELQDTLRLMAKALKKPIIRESDFGTGTRTHGRTQNLKTRGKQPKK